MKLHIFHRRRNSKLFYKKPKYLFNPWLISVHFLLSIQSLPLKLISSCAYYSKSVHLPSAYGLWACAFISVKSINYTCTFHNYKTLYTEGKGLLLLCIPCWSKRSGGFFGELSRVFFCSSCGILPNFWPSARSYWRFDTTYVAILIGQHTHRIGIL